VDVNVPFNVTSGDVHMSNNLVVEGNLTVQGTVITLNTSVVSIEDVNIDLASNATTHDVLNGGGITLGVNISDGNVAPSILYDTLHKTWDMNTSFNVNSGKTISVNDTDAILSSTGLQFGSSAAAVFLGGTTWKIVHFNDGVKDNLLFEHWDGAAYVTKFQLEG
jgi:hypothetical protein